LEPFLEPLLKPFQGCNRLLYVRIEEIGADLSAPICFISE
jgi:hypothetical protein